MTRVPIMGGDGSSEVAEGEAAEASMANWFDPYLVPRNAWPAVHYSEALAKDMNDRLQERFGDPWCTQKRNGEPPPPTWREAVRAVLQRDRQRIQQSYWVEYVAVAFVLVEWMSIEERDLGVLRHSELPGTLFPPCRYVPGIRVRQRPEDWFYVSYLSRFHIAAEIRHARLELQEFTAVAFPEWNKGIRRYLGWLTTAQKRGVHLAITFS
jgi:hypothetical protein